MTKLFIVNQDFKPSPAKNQVPLPLREEMIRTEHQDWLDALDTCGQNTKTLECCVCEDFHYPVRFHCKLKLCPDCTRRKAKEIREKFLPHLQELRNLKLITLTLKNTSTVQEGIELIRKSLKRFRQRKEIRARLIGGVYAIETTIGRDGNFHVHAHLLVSFYFISQERLSKIWAECNGGSPVVDIRKVKGGAKKALVYVTSYLSKGLAHLLDSWEPEKVIEYLEATIKNRLIAGIGVLYDVKLPREKLRCPHCGESMFKICNHLGQLLFDAVALLQRRAWNSS